MVATTPKDSDNNSFPIEEHFIIRIPEKIAKTIREKNHSIASLSISVSFIGKIFALINLNVFRVVRRAVCYI